MADVPSENAAMMKAPSTALADNEATNNAEYSKPHGIRAHPTPSTKGAFPPMDAITGCLLYTSRCV